MIATAIGNLEKEKEEEKTCNDGLIMKILVKPNTSQGAMFMLNGVDDSPIILKDVPFREFKSISKHTLKLATKFLNRYINANG